MNRPLETLSGRWKTGMGSAYQSPSRKDQHALGARIGGYSWGDHLSLAMRMPFRSGVQGGDEPFPVIPNDLGSRHGQRADEATVILDPEVERVLGSIDAGLGIAPYRWVRKR